jgi:predicted MPP superfamily phosphohydrolase
MRRALRWLTIVGAIGGVALGVSAIVGYREAVSDPVMRTAGVVLPDWPAGATPIRIALLSDIHIGNAAMDEGRLTRIVGQVDAARPDLIVLAGDFIVGHRPGSSAALAPRLTAPLAGLHAPLGVFAVLGNHDHWTGATAVVRALGRAGIATLSNRAVSRGPVTVVGVDDAFSGHADVPRAMAAARGRPGARVIVSHSPDVLPSLRAGDGHVVLLGHTHCGQIVWPHGQPLAAYSPFNGSRLFDPRYRCGVIRDPDRTVVVTAGVGSGTVPIRLGAPPDWWLVTVKGR